MSTTRLTLAFFNLCVGAWQAGTDQLYGKSSCPPQDLPADIYITVHEHLEALITLKHFNFAGTKFPRFSQTDIQRKNIVILNRLLSCICILFNNRIIKIAVRWQYARATYPIHFPEGWRLTTIVLNRSNFFLADQEYYRLHQHPLHIATHGYAHTHDA